MKKLLSWLFLVSLCVDGRSETAGRTEPIASDWRPPGSLRRLRVSSASASTTLDPSTGNYIPAKLFDRDRHSKWVASETPSTQAPQWAELKFSREQQVSAVAVFGERIGNDGIVDAQIRIATADGKWMTIAAVTNAVSGAWLASFPATNTTGIQLFITRSSGPSPHTDVYEVEIYGPQLPAAELEQATAERLAVVRQLRSKRESQPKPVIKSAWLNSVPDEARELDVQLEKCDQQFKEWKTLSVGDQQRLAEEVDALSDRVVASQTVAATREHLFQSRLKTLQAARDAFNRSGEMTHEERADRRIEIANRRVVLWCAKDSNKWTAIWNGAADAAVFEAGFDLEADGKHFAPTNVRNEVKDFSDASGRGKEIVQRWGEAIQIARAIRIYDSGAITLSGEIKNSSARPIALGSVHPLIVAQGNGGGYFNGDVSHVPAAVYLVGASEWQCSPGRNSGWSSKVAQSYASSQVLHLADTETPRGLTAAFLSAFTARPDLNAEFRTGEGGVSLSAHQNFLGRRLNAGETLVFDPLYLCANDDAYSGLEQYADMAARFANGPVRHGATALWCSWYGHRMDIDENLVLANAAVAAKYLKPLGVEIMQLDHGWQAGDITGDWIPDTNSFPHGFKWLSEQLQSRYGLKLGLWIAPTDVAETTETFRQHPDWMLKDAQGKPLVNWRWYWKPNPNCYELDASNPNAARWMEDVFARLSAEGVSYYKIDFIAASAGEQFVQQDPGVTRGWSVLRQAMESVRRGAGTNAWIRYCQPPPLLSAGLADSAYGGDDTSDAGLNGDIHVLRSNARSLAASSWLNDRLYHREVCDMSVRMQADIEEVRMRLALMTLADCSISFSDELQYLPSSRIRMMQACLPPGNPPMKALDLFERTIPSIWAIHCKTDGDEWDVVGLFNFENTAEPRTIDFSRLNLPVDVDVAAFEFWEQKLGIYRTNLTVTLPPQTSRIFALRRVSGHPQIVGTDLHLLQGQHELKHVAWANDKRQLSGECERAAGIEGKVFIHVPTGYTPHFEFPLNKTSARLTHIGGTLWAYELNFAAARALWSVPFDQK